MTSSARTWKNSLHNITKAVVSTIRTRVAICHDTCGRIPATIFIARASTHCRSRRLVQPNVLSSSPQRKGKKSSVWSSFKTTTPSACLGSKTRQLTHCASRKAINAATKAACTTRHVGATTAHTYLFHLSLQQHHFHDQQHVVHWHRWSRRHLIRQQWCVRDCGPDKLIFPSVRNNAPTTTPSSGLCASSGLSPFPRVMLPVAA